MTTELRLTVDIPAGSTGPVYLDLACLYSAANHRFISQAHIFTANFIAESAPAALGGQDVGYKLEVIPTTWPVMGAYKYGRRMYEQAMKPESDNVKKSRWNDFRIYYESAHRSQASNVLPNGVSYTPLIDGEYQYTKVYDDGAANTFNFHMLGSSDLTGPAQSFAMVEQYDQRDNTDIEAIGGLSDYDRILNDYNEANESELQNNGDLPPYNSTNLQLPEKKFILHATGSGATGLGYSHKSTGYIDVPFGLVKITNLVEGVRQLIIVFKAGKTKGIQAVKV